MPPWLLLLVLHGLRASLGYKRGGDGGDQGSGGGSGEGDGLEEDDHSTSRDGEEGHLSDKILSTGNGTAKQEE